MSNSNWTQEEVDELIRDYESKTESSDLQFSVNWGKEHGRSMSSVRNRVQKLKLEGKASKPEKEEEQRGETTNVEYGDDYINVVCASRRIRSQEDAIKEFGIDLNIWRVVKCRIGTHEGYRKDKVTDWHV